MIKTRLTISKSYTGIRKKILKIPKGISESVNRRRTDNKRKSTKGQTTIYKTLHIKQKIE